MTTTSISAKLIVTMTMTMRVWISWENRYATFRRKVSKVNPCYCKYWLMNCNWSAISGINAPTNRTNMLCVYGKPSTLVLSTLRNAYISIYNERIIRRILFPPKELSKQVAFWLSIKANVVTLWNKVFRAMAGNVDEDFWWSRSLVFGRPLLVCISKGHE